MFHVKQSQPRTNVEQTVNKPKMFHVKHRPSLCWRNKPRMFHVKHRPSLCWRNKPRMFHVKHRPRSRYPDADRGENRLIEGPRGVRYQIPPLQFCQYTGTAMPLPCKSANIRRFIQAPGVPPPYPKVPIAPLANRLSIGISL